MCVTGVNFLDGEIGRSGIYIDSEILKKEGLVALGAY